MATGRHFVQNYAAISWLSHHGKTANDERP